MTQPCLEVRDLWFGYPTDTVAGPAALRGLSLTIATGDFVALIGQNGSGKTTLAKHFNGLLRPTKGQVLLNGQNIADTPVSKLSRSVGYVFQNPDHQIFSPTVREEIAAGPRNLGLDDGQVRQQVAETLSDFNLDTVADRQPAILSFGLRRKVSVAAVFAMQTPILILDEPTAGLDRRNTIDLMQRICDRHRAGHTIILISHDMRLVAQYAPRCLVLSEGRVLAYDETRAIFRQADLLRQTQIEPPQITTLSYRLAPLGMPDDILTVPEFCAAYEGLWHKIGQPK